MHPIGWNRFDPGTIRALRFCGERVVRALAVAAAIGSAATDSQAQPPAEDCAPYWLHVGPFGGDVRVVDASAVNPDVGLAGMAEPVGEFGILYRTTSGGASWTPVTAFHGRSIWDVEFSPDGSAYVATSEQAWKTSDLGVTFTQLNLVISSSDNAVEMTIDPTNPMVVWAGTNRGSNRTRLVLRSSNAGVNWTERTPPITLDMGCRGIALHPADTHRVYAAFGGDLNFGQVWVSADAGATWVNRTAGLPNGPLADIEHNGTRLFVGGGSNSISGSHVYSSDDDGVTWTLRSNASWPSSSIRDITIDPANPNRILVSTRSGLNESLDNGVTWSLSIGGTAGREVFCTRFQQGDASIVRVGLELDGVWRSDDGGASFYPSVFGLALPTAWRVAVHPLIADEMAVAVEGLNDGGVYRTIDSGKSWHREDQLPRVRFGDVRYTSDGTLYAVPDTAVALSEGVIRRDPGTGVWTALGPDPTPALDLTMYVVRPSEHHPGRVLVGGRDFGSQGGEAFIWRRDEVTQTWTKVFAGPDGSLESVRSIEYVADGTDDVILACVQDTNGFPQTAHVYRSTDGGWTWNPSASGLLPDARVDMLVTSPVDPSLAFLVDAKPTRTGALYRSDDAGQTWTNMRHPADVESVACDGVDPEIVYVRQQDTYRVVVSYDRGVTFADFSQGIPASSALSSISAVGGDQPRLFAMSVYGAYVTRACGTDECATPECDPADVDGDCAVGLGDLSILLSSFGLSGVGFAEGDLDGDGDVDLADLSELLGRFGAQCAGE